MVDVESPVVTFIYSSNFLEPPTDAVAVLENLFGQELSKRHLDDHYAKIVPGTCTMQESPEGFRVSATVGIYKNNGGCKSQG